MVSPKRFRSHFKKFELLAKTKFGWIDNRLYGHDVWVFKRHSVAGGLGLGVALAFVPLPIQMLLCLPFALFFKVNLPVALASVWLGILLIGVFLTAPQQLLRKKLGTVKSVAELDYFEKKVSN